MSPERVTVAPAAVVREETAPRASSKREYVRASPSSSRAATDTDVALSSVSVVAPAIATGSAFMTMLGAMMSKAPAVLTSVSVCETVATLFPGPNAVTSTTWPLSTACAAPVALSLRLTRLRVATPLEFVTAAKGCDAPMVATTHAPSMR